MDRLERLDGPHPATGRPPRLLALPSPPATIRRTVDAKPTIRVLLLSLLSLPFPALRGAPPDATDPSEDDRAAEPTDLPPLHREGEPYRTPRAGEGFRTDVFGRDVVVPPRDRRSVTAWDIGLAATIPGATGKEVLPFGSLYFFRHPDEDTLLRAIVAGLYNDVVYADSPSGWGPFEWLVALESLTVPTAQAELIDGARIDEEELVWGYVRGGLGLGYREPVAPGAQDNMFAVNLRVEPSFFYFDEGDDAVPSFVAPEETFETRLHLRVRLDRFVRNLLELPHRGFATGADLSYGYRAGWESWGTDRSESAGEGRDFVLFTAYAVTASGVPFVESDRHRLLFYLHGGVGEGLDRFSAERVGGGPQGEERLALARPILPGAAIREFFPERYAIGVVEYRYETIFFNYIGPRASLAWLDRDRRVPGGFRREEDVLASVGMRVTSGFLGETRLQIDYNYNFDVVRNGDLGGHEIMAHISREF